ncbi:MAG: class I SAM-dependent methyltransferase [Patescibacteria group bacterium]
MNLDQYFKPVDGFEDPLSVIATDLEWPKDERRIWVPESDRPRILARQENFLGIDRQGRAYGWQLMRPLYDLRCDAKSYAEELSIRQGSGIREMFKAMAKLCGRSPLSVLDFGCGTGFAMSHMGDYKRLIDPVVGINLLAFDIIRDVRDKIRVADAINLAPNLEQNPDARFDAVFVIFGASHYSPLNRRPHSPDDDAFARKIDLSFGNLQALNFLKVGGFALIKNFRNDASLKLLIDMGILAKVPELEKFKRPKSNVGPGQANFDLIDYVLDQEPELNVYRLMRRPTPAEIKVLLKLKEDNCYTGFLDANFEDFGEDELEVRNPFLRTSSFGRARGVKV